MLNETLLRAPRTAGRQVLLRRGTRGAAELSVSRLRLAAGATEEYVAQDEETIVVLQEGSGTLAAGGHEWTVSRRNVFEERATALYLPPVTKLRVAATAPLEAVLLSAASTEGGEPALVGPGEARGTRGGKGPTAPGGHVWSV